MTSLARSLLLMMMAVGVSACAPSPSNAPAQAVAPSEPDGFRRAADDAIITNGTPESVPLLLAALRKRPRIDRLRDIAEIGEGARDAGPDIVALLSASNHDVRVAAARTLGFIAYDGDPAPLVKLLDDEDDWQVVYVAAEALGRLGTSLALPVLDKVATTHWYPPVRESARLAASVIRGSERYPPPDPRFGVEFFKYDDVRGPWGSKPPLLIRGPSELSPCELKSLAKGEGTHVGVRTGSGILVGTDEGEWGGQLVYLAGRSPPVRLLRENVRGIYRLPMGIVVVAGLAHFMANHGALYRVKLAGPDRLEVSYWKRLPGAPLTSGVTRDGSLFLTCIGGDVLLKPDGRLEMF